jgi:hypothetical protein
MIEGIMTGKEDMKEIEVTIEDMKETEGTKEIEIEMALKEDKNKKRTHLCTEIFHE